jgi:hypothetical protein
MALKIGMALVIIIPPKSICAGSAEGCYGQADSRNLTDDRKVRGPAVCSEDET